MHSILTRVLLTALTSGLFAAGAAAAPQDSWPTYQANAGHTGYLPIALDPNSIQLKWSTSFPFSNLDPVTAADGKVFLTIDGGAAQGLYVLDKDSGQELWKVLFASNYSVNPASYDSGRVYVQTGNHASDTWLRCYDATTGAQIFRSPFLAQWQDYYAPTIVDGVVYINGGSYGGMYAFDAITGLQRWFATLPQYDEWTPAVDAQRAYAYVGGWFYALNRTTGAVDFSFQDPAYNWSGYSMYLAPVLGAANDAFFIHGGRLVCVDLQTRGFRWSLPTQFTGQPALRNGVVYAIRAGSLEAFAAADGAFLWRWIPSNGVLVDAVALTDTHALVRTATETHLISLQTQQSEWMHPASGRMTISESNLYLSRTDGTLMCFAYQATPKPLALQPSRQAAYGGGTSVTITGTGFEDPAGTSVFFGGVPATNVTVLNDTTIVCTAPDAPPGRVDLQVTDGNGTGTLPASFNYTPAQILSGDFRPGGRLEIVYAVRPGYELVALWSRNDLRAQGLATPPFLGEFWLTHATVLFHLPAWPTREYTFSSNVPADPRFSGRTLHFQALSGVNLNVADAPFGTWSNVVSATIL